jgi:hypothetical protein
MLTSLRNVQGEFMKCLVENGQANATINSPEGLLTVPYTFARASAQTLAEKPKEQYPLISIYDYSPIIDTEWTRNFQQHVTGYHAYDNNGNPTKAFMVEDPIRLIFRFDYTFFVNNPMHKYTLLDFVLKKFNTRGTFILNKIVLPDGEEVGDVVNYTVAITENERSDGVFETNFEFTSKIMVAIKEPEEFDLIQNFNIFVNNINI